MNNIKVKFNSEEGVIKPVNGVGNGPLTSRFYIDVTEKFKDAGITYSRLHDTEGYMGSGEFVNVHCVFPNFDADVKDPHSYNFACTDEYLKAIINAGTKIFYRLGETIELSRKVISYINPPKDYEKWAQICEGIIRHYNEGWADGYYMNIEYWEIWNEPDNPKMWTGTSEEFYRLYYITANYLKKCFPNLKIGGFASSGFYAKNREEPGEWFKTLLPFMNGFFDYITNEKTKAPLDFFSWHCYTDSVEEIKLHAEYARDILDKYGFYSAESILNEWNYAKNWGAKEAKLRKSQLAAAMVASAFIVMQKGKIDLATYYDAEVNRIAYCGLFNEYSAECEKPYYSFMAYKVLYDIGKQIETEGDTDGIYCLGAYRDGKGAILLTNYGQAEQEVALLLEGLNADISLFAEHYLLDDLQNLELVKEDYIVHTNDHIMVHLKVNDVMLIRLG